jgi:hypothetical protein
MTSPKALGGHTSAWLLINMPGVVAAYETDLLEDDGCGGRGLILEREGSGETGLNWCLRRKRRDLEVTLG